MRKISIWLCLVSLLIAAAPVIGRAAPLDAVELLPVLHSATVPGLWKTEPAGMIAPAARTVDGNISDWIGTSARYAGASIVSAGELIYTDHLFDAYGADNGTDADRVAKLGPLEDAAPQTYRIEPLLQADAPGEIGVPNPYPVAEEYGDAGLQSKADLVELRIAADETTVYVLARTAAKSAATDTAVLLLADTNDGTGTRDVPFNAGITTDRADVAVLLASGGGRAVDLASHSETPVDVAAQPDGYVNAIEAAIPRAQIQRPDGSLQIAVATGNYDQAARGFATLPGVTSNLANVAFRGHEPVRTWFDEQQAISLYARTIDPFFTAIDTDALTSGANERPAPGPGYYERVFTSDAAISSEGGIEGIFQPYGVYLPPGYDTGTSPVPMTWWFHWRGGKAHSAATTTPRFMREMGDGLGGIVVSPRGRGTSSWYLGRGMVDFNEVWNDATSTYRVDFDRVYISGHSMGGWASYLMPILYPDRFAASFPVSPPVTQGAWTGLDFPGCDDYRYDDYSFCYEWANDSNPRAQHTYKMLENLRNVPIAIYAGGIDELVPVSGTLRQAERLAELGYRYRLYLFPTYEHYTPPIVDQWAEGAWYFRLARREANPARVGYIRDMPFEQSVEKGPSQFNSPMTGLNFDFDHAYWMSGLTPTDPVNGRAVFDGRTFARTDPSALTVPEAGGPSSAGQTGPYSMSGLTWLDNPLQADTPSNGFAVSLTGASSVQIDVARMGLNAARPIAGSATTNGAATLRLAGGWTAAPTVTVNGAPVAVSLADGVLSIPLTNGANTIAIG